MWDLFVAWLRIGLFGFGGGPSVLPLVRAECVDRYHWLTDEEFLDGIAFGNALPGPIAVKLAAWVGNRVAGPLGCAVAVFALSAPSVAMMLGLGAAYFRWRDVPVVAGALRGVRPAIVAMLAWTAFTLAPDGIRDWRGGLLAGAAFVALVAEVHPAIVVAVSIALGALLLRG
ncbi:MAG: chromate transporter [Myxococcota bacterium]